MPTQPLPSILVANHQDQVPVDLIKLEQLLPKALAAVLGQTPGPSDSPLSSLEEIEVTILSDEEIAEQHEVFLGDPSPTDVITFQHGELLISADTAARECSESLQPLERELLLYSIHGLLHLRGYDDLSASDREQMHAVQDRILALLWPE